MKTTTLTNHLSRGVTPLLIAFMLVLFGACGGSSDHQIVSDIEVSAYTDSNADINAEFSALLDLGNVSLPTVNLPVIHPKTGEVLGEIMLQATFDGGNEITLSVNLTNALMLQGYLNATLPNGQQIPVGGLGETPVVQLPVGGTSAQVYIAMDSGVALLGVAIPIKEMDGIGNSLGGISFFPRFNIGEVVGIAGIFTSQTSGGNGIALFVDLSSVVNPANFIEREFSSLKSSSLIEEASLSGSSKLIFVDKEPSRRKKQKLMRKIYDFHKKSKKLNLQ